MKRLLINIIVLTLFTTNSFADVSLILPNCTGDSGTQVVVPVKVKDFISILSFQGTIEFDTAVVKYVSIQQYGLPGMNAGNFGTSLCSSGKLTFSWFDGSLVGQTLADSSVLFSITFNLTGYNGQSSYLNFTDNPTPLEIVNSSYVSENVIIVNGNILIQNQSFVPDVTIFADSVAGDYGTQVNVSVRAFDFLNINSVQGTIGFDTAIVSYLGIGYYGLPGMNSGSFGISQVANGKLTFSWNDGTLNGINMPDSSALFTIIFYLKGNPGNATPVDFPASPTPFEITDSLYNILNADVIAGQVSIISTPLSNSVFLYLDTVSGANGSQVQVSMHAIDFTGVISAQGTLEFDTAIAIFDSVVYYGLPYMSVANFGTSLIANGKLMYSWNDPTLTGVTVPDSSIIFTMLFTITGVAGTYTPVDFIDIPTPQEYVDYQYNILNDSLAPGRISVLDLTSLTLSEPIQLIYCTGDSVSISYITTGTFNAGNIFILQMSDTSGSFTSAVDIDTIFSLISGTFNSVLPAFIMPGNGYHFRVISTDPAMQTLPNTDDISVITVLTAAPVSGNGIVCKNQDYLYYTNPVPGAISYTWTLPSGWSGTSIVDSIIATAGFSTGMISVTANNQCGQSLPQILAVVVDSIPFMPPSIIGDTLVCDGVSEMYFVNPIPGASSYSWMLPPGWSGTSNVDSIIAGVYNTSGNITVTANNHCGVSSAQTLTVIVDSIPDKPGIVTGDTIVCDGTINLYSVNPVPGASSYSWSLPTGWSGTSITNSISATAINTSGNITVTANNHCGISSVQTLIVIVDSIPDKPGIVTGDTIVCDGTINLYSVNSVPGASSYSWSLPTGWNGTSITNTISATAISTSGNIIVTANNQCGTSLQQTMYANVILLPNVTLVLPYDTVCLNYSSFALSGGNPTGGTYSGDGINAGIFDPATAGLGNHNIFYVYSDVNSCTNSDTASLIVDVCSQISENFTPDPIIVSPNPFTSEINIIIPQEWRNEIYYVSLYDIHGKNIRSWELEENVNNLDVKDLAKGLYLLILQYNNVQQSIKIIKE